MFSDVLKKIGCSFDEYKDLRSEFALKVPLIARAVVYPNNETELVRVLQTLTENMAPFIVVGRMSNILFNNGIYNGIVVKTTKIRTYLLAENTITLSCGASISNAARILARNDLGGFEGLVGIPGSIGGMLRQNAGAFTYEISDRFIKALCYFPRKELLTEFSKEDMNFSYRNSGVKRQEAVIINATFEAIPRSSKEVMNEINECNKKRRASQPYDYPSLGSAFKKVNGISAGYYIEKAGLKGFRIGGAKVSDKHAGFIINTGGATCADYIELLNYVKLKVNQTFDIWLEEEIEVI